MPVKTIRLISEKTACQILRVTPDELNGLCAEAELTQYQTSDSPVQYDFAQVVEYRQMAIDAATPTLSGEAIQLPHSAPASGTAVPDGQVRPVQQIIAEKKLEKDLRDGKCRMLSPSDYHHFVRTPLYYQDATADTLTLYKPADTPIPEEQFEAPPRLCVLNQDWASALNELKSGIIGEIRAFIDKEAFDSVRKRSASYLDLILSEHSADSFLGLEEIVELLFNASNQRKGMLTSLTPLIEESLTPGLHATRVLVLALKFCIKNNYSTNDSKLLGLSTILHDVGKAMLPDHLINCNPYQLTSEEDLRLFKLHPQLGYSILEDCGIQDKILKYGALEHHERINGDGYPDGKRKVSFLGQIIGIFDCYDSLCNGRNATGKRFPSIEALKQMKKECDAGSYSRELFETFVYGLM